MLSSGANVSRSSIVVVALPTLEHESVAVNVVISFRLLPQIGVVTVDDVIDPGAMVPKHESTAVAPTKGLMNGVSHSVTKLGVAVTTGGVE